MKKHVSVFVLMLRHSAVKVLIIFLLSAAIQSALFYLKFKNALLKSEAGLGMRTLEKIIEESKIVYVFAAAFLALTVILCRACSYSSGKLIYTLRRLSVSSFSIFLWQALAGVIFCFFLWAYEAALVYIFSTFYIQNAPGAAVSGQTIFLAFYKNSFLHGLLPLNSYSTYIRNIIFAFSVGICSATFSAYSRIGKVSWGIIVIVPLILLSFSSRVGAITVDALLCFYALFAAGFAVWNITKKEGGINEEI